MKAKVEQVEAGDAGLDARREVDRAMRDLAVAEREWARASVEGLAPARQRLSEAVARVITAQDRLDRLVRARVAR